MESMNILLIPLNGHLRVQWARKKVKWASKLPVQVVVGKTQFQHQDDYMDPMKLYGDVADEKERSSPGFISNNETLWINPKTVKKEIAGDHLICVKPKIWTVRTSVVCTHTASMSLAKSQRLIMGLSQMYKKKRKKIPYCFPHAGFCAAYTWQRPQPCAHAQCT